MYTLPYAADSAFYTSGINVLKFSPESGWTLAFRKTERAMAGSDQETTRVVSSASGKQGVVDIFYHSGAGTVTTWQMLASIDGHITGLDPAKLRAKALSEREYADNGYNGVKTGGDFIVEKIPGYTPHAARCCLNRPPLELRFRFTGRALVLDSVKEIPYKPPPGAVRPLLRVHENGLWAYGYQLADGFLVYGGSESPKEAAPSTPPAILALRKTLVEEETFGDAGGYLILNGLYKFASRSIAASVMLARSADGTEWKDENGRPVPAPKEDPINLTVLGVSGIWTGFYGGGHNPIVVKLEQHGQTLSGTVTTYYKPRPIQNAEFRNAVVSFDVQESTYTAAHLVLRLADGRLRGDYRIGNESSRVTLSRWNELYANVPTPTSLPTLSYRVAPQYPEGSSRDRAGTVVLQVEIDETGRISPDRIKVLRSMGADFDQKAIDCVKQWRFQPGYIEGKPVSTSASLEVVFRP
jgi:TonB family protein